MSVQECISQSAARGHIHLSMGPALKIGFLDEVKPFALIHTNTFCEKGSMPGTGTIKAS